MTKSKIIIFIILAIVVITTLFIPPFYGKGDDGSFYSILIANGMYNSEGADPSHFNSTYGVSTDGNSEFLPLTTAKALSAFASTTVFDIRVLAVLYLPFYLWGMYLVIKAIKINNKTLEIVVSALAAIIFADIGYISYMNSLYYEALYLVAFLLFIGSILNIKKENGVCILCALTFILSCGVLAFMGVSGLIAGVVAAAVLVLGGTVLKNISPFAALCGVLAAIVSFSCFFMAPQGKTSPAKLYSRVFDGAVYSSEKPEGDLEKLGIEKSYADFAGKSYFEAVGDNEALSPAFLQQLEKVSEKDILGFYVKNPMRFIKVLSVAGKNSPFLSQSYIATKTTANYYIKMAPGIWSYVRNFTIPANFWILVAISLLALVFSIAFFRKDTAIMTAGITLSVSALVFFISSVLNGGLYLISRNLIMHQAAVDLMVILIAVCAINIILEKRQELKNKFGVNQ